MTAEINGYISPYPVDPMPEWVAALRQRAEPVWIFAYGSLMWNPEMPFAERRPALLRGYHRSFCLYSRDYRGTPERPGLVLGLDRGGTGRGYLANTVRHLEELGIEDGPLHRLHEQVEALAQGI